MLQNGISSLPSLDSRPKNTPTCHPSEETNNSKKPRLYLNVLVPFQSETYKRLKFLESNNPSIFVNVIKSLSIKIANQTGQKLRPTKPIMRIKLAPTPQLQLLSQIRPDFQFYETPPHIEKGVHPSFGKIMNPS